jgi:hypothetical protein
VSAISPIAAGNFRGILTLTGIPLTFLLLGEETPMTIPEMLAALQATVDSIPRRGQEAMQVELWTSDGVNVGEDGKGAKLSLVIHAKRTPIGAEDNLQDLEGPPNNG